ncbi:MAG: LysR family transcriptional regulator [Candidatus Bathyarchaeia archaeon]|jgi:molybdate transport repressor ModE-like protein
MEHSKPHPEFKVWIETDDGYVFGPGVYSLLKRVNEVGTLKEAAIQLGMSYRYAWGLIRKAEEKLGEPLLLAHKGGRSGGGGAELTERGKHFLIEFQRLRDQMTRASEADPEKLISGVVKDINVSDGEVDVVLRISAYDRVRLRKGEKVNLQL